MELLLNIGLLIGFVFLMTKFGCGKHIGGHGSHARRDKSKPASNSASNEVAGDVAKVASEAAPSDPGPLTWVAPEKDVDPVCGKAVVTKTAKSSVHAGNVFYFCSRDCREVFEAAPGTYVGDPKTPKQPRQLEKSHV